MVSGDFTDSLLPLPLAGEVLCM